MPIFPDTGELLVDSEGKKSGVWFDGMKSGVDCDLGHDVGERREESAGDQGGIGGFFSIKSVQLPIGDYETDLA